MSHSFILKLDRAREHLSAFDQKGKAWIETKPYGMVDEPDPEPPPHPLADPAAVARRFRVVRVDPVPEPFSLIIGDCLFNLRSALDHLAISLARSHTPGMTERQVRGSEFPIFDNEPDFRSSVAKKIGCIDPVRRPDIEKLQPYKRASGRHSHPLWKIHELNRIDKHQVLTACISSPTRGGDRYVGYKIPEGGHNVRLITYVVATPGELKIDEIFLRYGAILRDPNREPGFDPHLPLEIAFGQGQVASLEIVVPTLQAVCDFVRDSIIGPLSKFVK